MVEYTLEQRIFLYDTYVKCSSARQCQTNFHHKFPDVTIPSRTTVHNLVNKVRRTGSILNKKRVQERRVLTEEKLDEIGARLENTPQKSLKCLAQETGISKSSAAVATKLLKLKPFKVLKPTEVCSPHTPVLKKATDVDTHDVHKDEDYESSSVDENDTSDELTLLGSIKAPRDGSNIKKKKKKHNKTQKKVLTEKDLAARHEEQIAQLRKKYRISVNGKNVPPPLDSFKGMHDEFGISSVLIQNLRDAGYEDPTPIQIQAIPVMMQGRQILACAPTGSGKTAAFLVPLIHHLGGPRKLGFRAVIVSPTRELASQTYRECVRLSEGTGLRCHIISKTSQAVNKFGPQSSQKFDILITTPNRLVYLLQQDPPILSLNNVEWLVVDESDKLFEAGPKGFRDQLAVIYKACDSNNVKRAMFSATHTVHVARWAKKNLKGLICVTVGHRNAASDDVDQKLLFVGSEAGKMVALRELVQKGLTPPVLIFVQTKERAKELFSELIYDGINVDVIHADRTQLQRDNVVRSFRSGQVWVLICTELMGRGIDFKGVNLVINYDFPPTAISYIHRIGRTGRAGRQGKAITFFTEDDTVNLRSIAHVLRESGCEVPEYMLTMKKASKRARRKLEQRAPQRESISTIPSYQIEKTKKLKRKIQESKLKKEDPQSTKQTVKRRKSAV
ncbi:probable ATP-dependent RNA helicase DDX52 isoform X1 [Periplaneta americana]|uniref:probable ATP-dependent RNA helicase DDX52 isoform X1 n=1 Tax=Periplaneta americana TaxID=6978 RepID=UPI0037E93AE9